MPFFQTVNLLSIVKDLEFVVANKVTRVINCAGT